MATTVCGFLFLLSVQCIVYARGEQTLARMFGVLGGYVTQRLHSCDSCSCSVLLSVHRSAAVELAEVRLTAQSDYVSNFATLSNYDNPPTSLFLALCGDIEENPGLSMEETFSKFGRNNFQVRRKISFRNTGNGPIPEHNSTLS